MKRSRALVEDRRNRILEILEEKGSVKVEDLAQKFGVSALTIRRDLQYLEDNKKIERFYGGASIIRNEETIDEDALYRKLIAKYAASLVEDGDSIFINSSSTALKILSFLENKRVIVITNNGKSINYEKPPQVSVVLTGGEVSSDKAALVGEFALKNLERVTAKKSFLGCNGLSLESGMTTEIMNEANINNMMNNRVTGETYILADHTKLGKDSSFVSIDIDNIKNVVTDEKADEKIVQRLRDKGINVHIVSKHDGI